ncbi:protein FAM227B isoform X3 [Pseudophryne corroboree]|uniref:protein FAM227B isoform X3 n=1 Tax=Pseudophryne corroboree TaxID=495146 RepID=UPI0030821954
MEGGEDPSPGATGKRSYIEHNTVPKSLFPHLLREAFTVTLMKESVAIGNSKHTRQASSLGKELIMQKPPATYEEFLDSQHLADWPEYPFIEELPEEAIPVTKYSLDLINEELAKNAPLDMNVLEDLEEIAIKNTLFVDKFASQILCSPTSDDHQYPLTQAFFTEIDIAELSQKAQEKMKAQARNRHKEKYVENCVFPGLKTTDLPGHLKANQMIHCVAKTQHFQGGSGKTWSKFLLSGNSVAIFQDCFWWFFLQRFKPQQDEQNHLFDRISDTFVTLFCSVPPDVRDSFFKIYPDFLSQAVFTAFYKAFPESHAQFNGEFKSEIVDIIFQWLSGIKPVPCSWMKWDLSILGKSEDQNTNRQINISQERIQYADRWRLEFNLDDLIQEARESNLPRTLAVEGKNATVKESHSIGPGPEFHHVLFKLGSHSLLVSHYLRRHKFTDFVYGGSTQRLKRTEISKLPSAGPTYEDVSKETQIFRKNLQREYEMLESKTQKELTEIQHQSLNVKWKIEKMKKELSSGVKLNHALLLEKLYLCILWRAAHPIIYRHVCAA